MYEYQDLNHTLLFSDLITFALLLQEALRNETIFLETNLQGKTSHL